MDLLTNALTIIILFNAPITEPDLDLIRSALTPAEGPSVLLLKTDEEQFTADPASTDWGLSEHPNATGIEIRIMDIDKERGGKLVSALREKLNRLPAGRVTSTRIQHYWNDGTMATIDYQVTPPGVPPPSIQGRPGKLVGTARKEFRFPSSYNYSMMGRYGGMPGGPEGDVELTPEESELWRELDMRANHLAARYKGEAVPGHPFPMLPPGAEAMMGPMMEMGMGAGFAGGPLTPLPTPSAEEKAEIEKELAEVLNQMFDLKLIAYERRISRLEEELKSLREEIEERKQNKGLIVQRRLKQLTGKEDHLAW